MIELSREFQKKIIRSGPLSFADFMRDALYHPEYGYYRSSQRVGRSGDFFTSVSVGPFFGRLLASQFRQWLDQLASSGKRLQCVEAGAHDGSLAFDIISDLQLESMPPASFEYVIIEPSTHLRRAQQAKLSDFSNVRWVSSIGEIDGVMGVIFSNELLDAMPVHMFRWSRQEHCWKEMGVDLLAGEFIWIELPAMTVSPPRLPEALLSVLPDEYTMEVSHEASRWWEDAAEALLSGKLMTIDYGGVIEELLSPSRTSGTLRAYSRQRVSRDVLLNPGDQDITAHVNFTDLQEIGHAAGLTTEIFTSQSQFLTAIARELWERTGSWPMDHVRQFQTLTHPEHLGNPFRVLVQARTLS
jgi:SAM-dependent MidA family methyltransferase